MILIFFTHLLNKKVKGEGRKKYIRKGERGKSKGGRKEEGRWKGDRYEIRSTLKSLLVLIGFDMQCKLYTLAVLYLFTLNM